VSTVRSTLLLCLALALHATPRSAQAQQAMDLPAFEDREAWMKAWLEVARDAHGPATIPKLTVSAEAYGWSLSVWNNQGTLRTVGIQQPHSHADRVDLLFLAISLAQPRDDWGWSAIPAADEADEADEGTEPLSGLQIQEAWDLGVRTRAARRTLTPKAEAAKPNRSFVSAGARPSEVSAALPPPSSPNDEMPEPPPIFAPGPDPLAPSRSTSAPTPDEPVPEPLDPLFPEPRDPIPILDDSNTSPWPTWAWVQLGAGPTWRPETTVAWEGSLRGGWTGERLRLGIAARATTPTSLLAFRDEAERTAWDMDLLTGPWVPLGARLDAGLEGGVAVRSYRQQNEAIAKDLLPTAAVELAARFPLGELEAGPYLRGTVDLLPTSLRNGIEDQHPVQLQLWSLTAGFQLSAAGAGGLRGGAR